MDLPDCPPGAEGYEDTVIEVPKKLDAEDANCTKAEQEFQDHLNSLKIKLEDGETRCMVERRGRDISGKWIYLCYPCAAVCSGESILQTHISGKKHKIKLSMRNVWPRSIFDEHPFNQNQNKTGATDKVLQKMAEEVDLHNKPPSELDQKFSKYRDVQCHIQDALDNVKAPLVGVEYLVEHPPELAHYEPSYVCTLCAKHGHPRTIINHMTCYWHRYNYLVRHYPKACNILAPYRVQNKYREGVSFIINRLVQRIDDTFGRMRPANIDKEEYEKDKERIHQWIFKSHHFTDKIGPTFEEVVDIGLLDTLHKSNEKAKIERPFENRDPSPPVVAAPTKPRFNSFTRPMGRQERRAGSLDSLSDVSDDETRRARPHPARHPHHSHHPHPHHRYDPQHKPRFDPYPQKARGNSPFNTRYAKRDTSENQSSHTTEKQRAPNYEYKVKLAEERRHAAEESARKTLAYHDKNPEKHPLYPEEWKKFWNRRYKEIQAEGKDPSKHDFKPEWIVFWTSRMKELHDEELRVQVNEIYRKLCLSPTDMSRESEQRNSSSKQRSPEPRRTSPRRRSPELRRRSPELRRRSPELRRRSPELRRRSPELRRRSPEPRRRSPDFRRDFRSDRRSPAFRRSAERRRSPSRHKHTRSRSPVQRARSPARRPLALEPSRRSRSPLSRRDAALPLRNRSPAHPAHVAHPTLAPSMQTVLVSDDELRPDDVSPWNSDNDMDSLCSLPEVRSRTGSIASRASRARRDARDARDARDVRDARDARNVRDARDCGPHPQELGPAENVVATLRLLVALEDYLGSLGPKIVDLLADALKMEKEKANSSEELLERESALVLIETAKEKLKGAVQAGLVAHGAAAAVRAAVVRAASTLHEADTRAHKKQQSSSSTTSKPASMPVAGVGEVDRAQIAQQMAEALIAQGKTDVSSEELAQLVDAVVGMAEAKKRDAEVSRKVAARAAADRASRPPPPANVSGTASALQMLQSAYDENDKKHEKEDAPDAMDGLSDSDLETLLKNFNELSAEEQHSLIAYLKKLEAREPERVERLRQYVSAAATTAPKFDQKPKNEDNIKLVTIESDDDDDYTVEEVFKSATQKVKEDQIRQEMEIVKKSLEESKAPPPVEQPASKPSTTIDLTNMSSAANLLALVQASIQSLATAAPAPITQTAEVVTSNTQPRSFGDLPETPMTLREPPVDPNETPVHLNEPPVGYHDLLCPRPPVLNMPHVPPQSIPPANAYNNPSNNPQGGLLRPPYNLTNFGGNRNVPNSNYNQGPWNQNQINNMHDNRGHIRGNMLENRGPDNYNKGQFNQVPSGNFMIGRQDNFAPRPYNNNNQPFGNYDNQNNFRGRGSGRGNFGGPMRGRGRGYY